MTSRAPRSARSLLVLALSLLAACGAEPPQAVGPAISTTPAGAPTSPNGLPAARMVFDDEILNFGTVSDTDDIVGSFLFSNVGDKALMIGEVKPSCGCTTVELDKNRFDPGEGSTIDVVWKPKGFGTQTKTILVYSNSSEQPIIQLVVRAQIEPFARFEPSPLRPGYLAIGREHALTVLLSCADPEFELQGLLPTHPAVTATAGERRSDGVLPIEVVIGADAPWGAFNCAVQATLLGRPEPGAERIEHRVDLTLNASLFGDLRVQPTLFAVGQVLPKRTFSRKIELRHVDGAPFQVTSLDVLNSQPPGITARLKQVDRGTEQGWTIVIDGDAGDYLGLIRATVRFETNVPGEEPRSIPVMGIVRE